MVLLKTANSFHEKCLVCNRKNKLRQVKCETVAYAYLKYKVVIKHHSRVCSRHLDENGLIRKNIIPIIPTKEVNYGQATKKRLDCLKMPSDQMGVFEKFNDMDTLTEEHCHTITGWTKCEFAKFSKYITSINNSSDRSKDELISILAT